METVIGLTAIAVALLIGLGALGVGIGMGLLGGRLWAFWVAAFLKVPHVSPNWRPCCRRKCLSLLHCSMPLR